MYKNPPPPHTHHHHRNNLNVVLVDTWRVVNAKGGAEKVFCAMANALVERGHNVTAVCHEKLKGLPGYPLDKRVNFVNAEGRLPFWCSKFFIELRAFRFNRERRRKNRKELESRLLGVALHDAFKKSNADCIISFQGETTHAIKPFIGDIPIVTMLHGNPEFYLETCPVFKEALNESTAVQFLMPEYAEAVKEIAPGVKTVCIPNAIPQKEANANWASHIIINVARFDPNQKRQDLLVQAFAKISRIFPEWTLELWGERFLEPDFNRKVEAIIAQNHLEKQVKLCGTTNTPDKEMRRASIFAFPSKYEGFPLALGEAMANGLPAIGWEGCPSVNTLIRSEQNGLLCDETPEAIAMGLARLMCDEGYREKLGKQAKKDMIPYAPKNVWDQWEKLIRGLVARHHG